eukprot:g4259.t1
MFEACDDDKNGHLDRSEFRNFLQAHNLAGRSTNLRIPSAETSRSHNEEHEINRLFDTIDRDGDQTITFAEFLQYAQAVAAGRTSTSPFKRLLIAVVGFLRNREFRSGLKILLKYLQVIVSIPLNFPEIRNIIQDQFKGFQESARGVSAVVDVDLSDVFVVQCVFGPRFFDMLARTTLLVTGSLILLVSCQIVVQRRLRSRLSVSQAERLETVSQVTLLFAVTTVTFTYPSVSRTILNSFRCLDGANARKAGGSPTHAPYGNWLDVDASIACDGRYLGLAAPSDVAYPIIEAFGTAMLFIFTLGVPLAIMAVLARYRFPLNFLYDLGADATLLPAKQVRRVASLYRNFTPDYWWFLPVDLLRHWVLTAFIGITFIGGRTGASPDASSAGTSLLGGDFPTHRLFFAIMFCLSFLFVYVFANVYRNASSGRLQITAHCCLIMLLAYLLSQYDPRALPANPGGLQLSGSNNANGGGGNQSVHVGGRAADHFNKAFT